MAFILLVALFQGLPDHKEVDDADVELRALQGYLGLYVAAQNMPSSQTWREDIGMDLNTRLEKFLDRIDLLPPTRAKAIEVYHQLARTFTRQKWNGSTEKSLILRDIYSRLIQRAEAAGQDSLSIELEMLSTPEIGLDARETYSAIARMMPRLSKQSDLLPPELSDVLKGVLRRILSESGWPDLESGNSLTETVQLLLRLGESERAHDAAVITKKLAEWTARLLKAEAAREGELAHEAAIIHLYRSLELAGKQLSTLQRKAVLEGLSPLEPPMLAQGAKAQKPFHSVEIGEVRLPSGARLRIPPLSPLLAAGFPSRYLLVPKKSYQVKLVCTGDGQELQSVFWVLARPGMDTGLMLPRSIPEGMVPVTLEGSGRIGFLADRKPWSIRRFLLAFQKCGNSLVADQSAVLHIYKHSVLREIPLEGDLKPSFAGLAKLLSEQSMKDRLEETFWVDSRQEASRAAAFEIAGAVLSGNTGLRDTALELPTVAEANRLLKRGELFGIVDHHFGLFNAIQMIPKPEEDPLRSRYVIRTVLRLASP